MGLSLLTTTPQGTYSSLLKITDNTSISGTAGTSTKLISDGAGIDTAFSINTQRLGINETSPAARLHITDATIPLRIGYDGSNFTKFKTTASGRFQIDPSGSDVEITKDLLISGGKITFGEGETIDNETDGLFALRASTAEAFRLGCFAATETKDIAIELWGGAELKWSFGFDDTDDDFHFDWHGGSHADLGANTKVKFDNSGNATFNGYISDAGVANYHTSTSTWVESWASSGGYQPIKQRAAGAITYSELDEYIFGYKAGDNGFIKIKADGGSDNDKAFHLKVFQGQDHTMQIGSEGTDFVPALFITYADANSPIVANAGVQKAVSFESYGGSDDLVFKSSSGDVDITAQKITLDPDSGSATIALEPAAGGVSKLSLQQQGSSDKWYILNSTATDTLGFNFNVSNADIALIRFESDGDIKLHAATQKINKAQILSYYAADTNFSLKTR